MGKLVITSEFNTDEATFWQVFFDKDFLVKLYTEALGFSEYAVLEQQETETELVRTVKGTPKMDAPGPIAKLLGRNFGYTEHGKFDRRTQVWSWKATPSTLAEKIRNEGSMRIEKIGDNRVKRVTEIVIEAKVFGLGGLIESTAEKQLRKGWEDSVPFMQKWIDGLRSA
jgi:hypothetical protein